MRQVQSVVDDARALFGGRLRGSDVHATVDADGVAGEDFGVVGLGPVQCGVGLAGGGRPGENVYLRRFAAHGRLAQSSA